MRSTGEIEHEITEKENTLLIFKHIMSSSRREKVLEEIVNLKEELARVKREGNEMTVEEMRKKIREIEEMKVELDKEIKELQLKQTVQTTIDNKYITGAFITISYTDEEDHEVYDHNFYVNKVQAVEVLKRLVEVSND